MCPTPCHPQATCVLVNNIPSPGPFPPFDPPQSVVSNPGGGLPLLGSHQSVGNNPFGAQPPVDNFPQVNNNPFFQNFAPSPIIPQPIDFPQNVDHFQNNNPLPPIIGIPRSRIASRQTNSNPVISKSAAASNIVQQGRQNTAPQIRNDPLPPQLPSFPEEEYLPSESNSSSLKEVGTAKEHKSLNKVFLNINDSLPNESQTKKEENIEASYIPASSNTMVNPLIQNNLSLSSTSAPQQTTTSPFVVARRTFSDKLLERILAAIAVVPEVAGHPDIKAKTNDPESYEATTNPTTLENEELTLPVSFPVTPQIEVLTHFNNTRYIYKNSFQALPLILGGSQANQIAGTNKTQKVQSPVGLQQAAEVAPSNTVSNFSPSTELREQINKIPIIPDIPQNGIQMPANEDQSNDLKNQAQQLVELLQQAGDEIQTILNVAQVGQPQNLEGAQTASSNQFSPLSEINQNLNNIIPDVKLQQISDLSSTEALPQSNLIPDLGTSLSSGQTPGENSPQSNFPQNRFPTGGNVPQPIGRLPESDNNFLVSDILSNENQRQKIPTIPDIPNFGNQHQQRIPQIPDVPNRKRPQFNNIPFRNNNAQQPATTQFGRRPIGANRESSSFPLIPDIPTISGQPFGPLPLPGNIPERQRIPINGGFQQFNNNPVTPNIGSQQFGSIPRPQGNFQFGRQPVGAVTQGQSPFIPDIPNSVRRPGSFAPPENFPYISDIQNVRRPPFVGNQPTNNFPQQPSVQQLGRQPFDIPQSSLISPLGNVPIGNPNQGFGELQFGVQPVGQILPAGQSNNLNSQFPNPLLPPQFSGGSRQYQCRCIPGYFGDGITSCFPSNNQRSGI